MARLALTRRGQFETKLDGNSHCGVTAATNNHGLLLIKYEFRAVCKMEGLDERGFLFDQLTVDKFFQSIKTTTMSCERLVVWCVRELKSTILKENPECVFKKISLTLSAAPHWAEMTYEERGSSSSSHSLLTPKQKGKRPFQVEHDFSQNLDALVQRAGVNNADRAKYKKHRTEGVVNLLCRFEHYMNGKESRDDAAHRLRAKGLKLADAYQLASFLHDHPREAVGVFVEALGSVGEVSYLDGKFVAVAHVSSGKKQFDFTEVSSTREDLENRMILVIIDED